MHSNRRYLAGLALAGMLTLGGCSGSGAQSDDTAFGASVVPPPNSGNAVAPNAPLGARNEAEFQIPPLGGTLPLPPTKEVTGTITFAPGAAPDTNMSVQVSETPVPGAIPISSSTTDVSTSVFYWLTFSTDKPFDLNNVESISLVDRPNNVDVLPAQAEIFHMPVAEQTASGTGPVLQNLAGSLEQRTAVYGNSQQLMMQPGKSYLMQAQATDTSSMNLFLKNDSEFPYAYYSIYGQNPVNDKDPNYYYVKDGKLVPVKKSDRITDTIQKIGRPEDVGYEAGYCNYNQPFPPSGQPITLPLVRAGRAFICLSSTIEPDKVKELTANNTTAAKVGELLLIRTEDPLPVPSPGLQPSPGTVPEVNVVQPNGWGLLGQRDYNALFDWVEFDYKISPDSQLPGMGVNKTEVDMFGFGITIALQNKDGTNTTTVGTKPDGRKAVFDALEADPIFKTLLATANGTAIGASTPGLKYLRAVSPYKATLNPNSPGYTTFSKTFFDDYIDRVWEHYKTTASLTVFTSAFGNYTGRVDANDNLVLNNQQPGFPALILKKPSTAQALEPTDYQGTKAFYSPSPGASPVIVPPPPAGVDAPKPDDPDKSKFTPFVAGETISALSAAFNRSTLLLEDFITRDYRLHPATLSKFYNTLDASPSPKPQPVNNYAYQIHKHALPLLPSAPGTEPSGGAAYAFGFDDNMNQSSFIGDNRAPSNMTITVLKLGITK